MANTEAYHSLFARLIDIPAAADNNRGMLPSYEALERYLRGVPGFGRARVLAITPVEGGASNLTCHVRLADAPAPALALRMQRERGIFEPYDVVREGEVVRRLAGSAVPVPQLVASEPSRELLGAPFILLEWVDAPHMGLAPDADFGAYTKAVASIHTLDWGALGLGFLGAANSPREALVREVEVIAGRMAAFGCEGDPLLAQARDHLRETAPDDGRLALCQGDINVFNYLFRNGEVVAVVDWEQARISDPRSDLGHLVALTHLKGAPFGPANGQPFIQAYAAISGREPGAMEWFRARWLFELGVIYHGWMSFNASEPWYSLPHLASLLEASLAEVR